MTKTEQAKRDAIEALLAVGFSHDGKTAQTTARVPTKASPLLGKAGGELRTFGGRLRFVLSGTNIRATVGDRTTSLYRIAAQGGVQSIAALDTKDIDGLRRELGLIAISTATASLKM